MSKRFRVGLVALAGAIPLLLSVVLPVSSAMAHGTTMNPPSRTWQCRFNESPENPQSAACKAAVKFGDRLTDEEIASLLAQRHLAQDQHHCPHGRPTSLVFTRDDLDRQFKRI